MAYPQVVFMVGTYDEEGNPDVMNAAWGGINSGEPPCVQANIRPERKTMKNIKAGSDMTIGIPSARHTVIADYFGIESGNKVPNKIEEALEAAGSEAGKVNAPVIDEFKLTLVCKVVNTFEFGSHIQVTGEIVDVLADEDILNEDGIVDIKKLDPLLYDHSAHEYYTVGEKAGNSFTAGLELK
jgi:flavin reductase (DIM6/NTAB) family NADH-FMN oxidoreductase RutF